MGLDVQISVVSLDALEEDTVRRLKPLVLERGSTLDEVLSTWETMHYYGDTIVIHASMEGKIVGWASLQLYSSYYTAAFFVSPYYRRQGIGTLLWNHALCIADQQELPLYVTEWNKTSHLFFSACGAKNIHTMSGYEWDSDEVKLLRRNRG